ncbi:MAG TPA: RNA polymerase sigma factor RpoD/SigA, partial [Ktedonobacteraceae bacterium]|nr:RNA polymerase sigma factor RpoD/SigA [Ktedonobacteraceae bacterium]
MLRTYPTTTQAPASSHQRARGQRQVNMPAAQDALGFYLREIRQISLLSKDEEQIQGTQAQAGDRQAWIVLVEANLPLVVNIARNYQGLGLDLADLVQEGAFGLMRAATEFDPARRVRFATMATWWIRLAIQRGLANYGRTIRLPVAQIEKQQQLARTQARLAQEVGAAATIEEIAEALGCDVVAVQRLFQQAQQVCSLDAPLEDTDADPVTLAETYADPRAEEALEAIEASASSLTAWEVLQILSEQERQVLILHLGL